MTLTEITEAPTKPPRDNRWVLAAIVAAGDRADRGRRHDC